MNRSSNCHAKKKYVTLVEQKKIRKERERARAKKRKKIIENWKAEEDPAKKNKLARVIQKSAPSKGGSIRTVSGGLPGLGKRK